MAVKKARLGRGLGALLEDTSEPEELDVGEVGSVTSGDEVVRKLPVELIHRGQYQPRTRMDDDALSDLAESIRQQGVVQPILVRELSTSDYEIIAGERRWRASQLAGLTEIPAIVRRIPDETAMAVALIENIQRENLNPIEEAMGMQRLIEEFGMTQSQMAEKVGRSRTGVTNLLRLLNLEPSVREYLESGQIDMGHARALLGLSGRAQSDAAMEVIDRALSVRETESLVRQQSGGSRSSKSGSSKSKSRDSDVVRLEREMSDALSAPVKIEHKGKKGRVVIGYHSLEELEGILDRMR